MAKVQIIVATHKEYWMPSDDMYFPLFVGAGDRLPTQLPFKGDNTGDNISEKNNTFCELTGLYWGWKNLKADCLGLCHYRRYFGTHQSFFGDQKKRLLTLADMERLLKDADVILPAKRHYWIETRGSQYKHAHHLEDLQVTEAVLKERYPDYLEAWNWMVQTRSGHICNMFVMRRELLDGYCTWLFDILFEVERRLDITSYSGKDQRVYGYLGERLLDVWIRKNRLHIKEVPMLTLEDQHWFKKGMDFIRRKFSE